MGDGNGWVECRFGHRHWGLHGAAGLLLLRPDGQPHGEPGAEPGAEPVVLMQLRAAWTHEGGRWGLPGGARDSHETIAEAAVREAGEEAGVSATQLHVLTTTVGADHGNWTYSYVIAAADDDLVPGPPNAESDALAWVPLTEVPAMPLHSGLAAAWPGLQPVISSALGGATGSTGASATG